MSETTMTRKDKMIPWYFVIFFLVVAILDGIFVYTAITTQTGVITDKAYEKGIAYNKILNKAEAQPDIKNHITFDNGILSWTLDDLESANVEVKFVRPVQDGHDFTATMVYTNGSYEIKPQFPLKGRWNAQFRATWGDNQSYHKTHPLIVQ